MTREEAIERLNIHKSTNVFVDSIAEAIDMAIEALQTLEAVERIKTEVLPQTEVYEDYEHATLVDIKEPLKVSVVRCKDCKWAEKAIFDEYCVECTMHHTTFMKHGFCNHGERREPT